MTYEKAKILEEKVKMILRKIIVLRIAIEMPNFFDLFY